MPHRPDRFSSIVTETLRVVLFSFILLGLGGIGVMVLAQDAPEPAAIPELPCAPLAAYAADLTTVRTGITGGGRRTRHEIVAAQDALRTCIDAHPLAPAAP